MATGDDGRARRARPGKIVFELGSRGDRQVRDEEGEAQRLHR